jgi:hypothetical protein
MPTPNYPTPFLFDGGIGSTHNGTDIWNNIPVPDLSERTIWLLDNAPINSTAFVSPSIAPNFVGAHSMYFKKATGAGLDKWEGIPSATSVTQIIQQGGGGGTPRRTGGMNIDLTGAIDSVSDRRHMSYMIQVNAAWVDSASGETLYSEEIWPMVLVSGKNRWQVEGISNLQVSMGMVSRAGHALPNFRISAAWNGSGIIVSANASVPFYINWAENNYLA